MGRHITDSLGFKNPPPHLPLAAIDQPGSLLAFGLGERKQILVLSPSLSLPPKRDDCYLLTLFLLLFLPPQSAWRKRNGALMRARLGPAASL